MKEKLIEQLYRRKQNSYYLTAIVGGYLVYLAWKIYGEIPGGTGAAIIAGWIAIVVFTIFGAALALISAWAWIKGYCIENATKKDAEEQATDEDKTSEE